jgi:hypothetical protein
MMNSVKRLRSEHLSKLAWIPLLARSTALARNTLTPRPTGEGRACSYAIGLAQQTCTAYGSHQTCKHRALYTFFFGAEALLV